MLAPIVRFSALAIAAALLVGCDGGSDPRDLVVGKWEHAGNVNEHVEIARDGAIAFSDGKGDLSAIRGRYTLEGDHIDFTLTNAQAIQTDEGSKYFAASWMTFEHMNAMMDLKEIKVLGTFTVTVDKLTLKIGDETSAYVRLKR